MLGIHSMSGPDKIVDAPSYTSNKLNQPVKLRLSEQDQAQYPSMSIYTMLKTVADTMPEQNALAFKATSAQTNWVYFNYSEYFKICNKAAKSFIKVYFYSINVKNVFKVSLS